MEKEVISQLAALAHERRLAIFRLLMQRYPLALPAGEIAQILDLPASSLSTCLANLRQTGLIAQARQGTSLRYSADPQAASAMITYLAADCCGGQLSLQCNIQDTPSKEE